VNEVSLFTGAGGQILASRVRGWRTIAYVEQDKHCCEVIEQRIKDGILDDSPIFQGDLRRWIELGYAARLRGLADVLTAGFPCQPYSVAGKRLGEDDPRNHWPTVLAAIRIIRPKEVYLENVPGLLSAGQRLTVVALEKIRELNLFGAKNNESFTGRFIRHVIESITDPYFGSILRDLSESGYNAKWKVVSAGEMGGAHKRDRLWIVAYAKGGEGNE
jgi:DNA (cytosine-5)-methyltransferase 1